MWVGSVCNATPTFSTWATISVLQCGGSCSANAVSQDDVMNALCTEALVHSVRTPVEYIAGGSCLYLCGHVLSWTGSERVSVSLAGGPLFTMQRLHPLMLQESSSDDDDMQKDGAGAPGSKKGAEPAAKADEGGKRGPAGSNAGSGGGQSAAKRAKVDVSSSRPAASVPSKRQVLPPSQVFTLQAFPAVHLHGLLMLSWAGSVVCCLLRSGPLVIICCVIRKDGLMVGKRVSKKEACAVVVCPLEHGVVISWGVAGRN